MAYLHLTVSSSMEKGSLPSCKIFITSRKPPCSSKTGSFLKNTKPLCDIGVWTRFGTISETVSFDNLALLPAVAILFSSTNFMAFAEFFSQFYVQASVWGVSLIFSAISMFQTHRLHCFDEKIPNLARIVSTFYFFSALFGLIQSFYDYGAILIYLNNFLRSSAFFINTLALYLLLESFVSAEVSSPIRRISNSKIVWICIIPISIRIISCYIINEILKSSGDDSKNIYLNYSDSVESIMMTLYLVVYGNLLYTALNFKRLFTYTHSRMFDVLHKYALLMIYFTAPIVFTLFLNNFMALMSHIVPSLVSMQVRTEFEWMTFIIHCPVQYLSGAYIAFALKRARRTTDHGFKDKQTAVESTKLRSNYHESNLSIVIVSPNMVYSEIFTPNKISVTSLFLGLSLAPESHESNGTAWDIASFSRSITSPLLSLRIESLKASSFHWGFARMSNASETTSTSFLPTISIEKGNLGE